jgi:hypothetical protein
MKDYDAAFEFVRTSRFLKVSGGLIAEGWVFREFSPSLMRDYIRSGSVMVMDGSKGIRGLAIYTVDREEDSDLVSLGFVDGDASSIKALARNPFYISRSRGYKYCSAAVPTRYFTRLLRWSVFGKSETIGQVIYELSGEELRRM